MSRVLLPALLILALLSGHLSAATFTVTNTNDSGSGSLRAAISLANATPGSDTIVFNIPGAGPHRIALQSLLPTISGALLIDGYSQPGALPNTQEEGFDGVVRIQLRGPEQVPLLGVGLAICGTNVTVRGLSIVHFNTSVFVGRTPLAEPCSASQVVVAGNLLGLSPPGLPDGDPNQGVAVFGGEGIHVGGTTAADRNLLYGLANCAVVIGATVAGGVRIDGNRCGFRADGSVIPAPDSLAGFLATFEFNAAGGSVGVLIGEERPNLIAGRRRGIVVLGAASQGIRFGRNHFRANLLDIDLNNDGLTPNDPDDADAGPNGLQNFPLLTTARRGARSLTIQGSLDRPGGIGPRTYEIAYYLGRSCSERRLLAVRTLSLLASNENFSHTLGDIPPPYLGDLVSATATDASTGDSSEMSPCVAVQEDPNALLVSTVDDSGAGSLRAAIQAANADPGPKVIRFAIPGPGPRQINLQSHLPDITQPLLIDGYSQAGAIPNSAEDGFNGVLQVQIRGPGQSPQLFGGLGICGPNITIRGLSIVDFTFPIRIGSETASNALCPASNAIVSGNLLGLSLPGLPDGGATIAFFLGGVSAQIGGAALADGNFLHGSQACAQVVGGTGAESRRIDGNRCGLRPDGSTSPSGGGFNFVLARGAWLGEERPNLIVGRNRGALVQVAESQGNRLSQNVYQGNTTLAIDLNVDLVTPNDPDDADVGPNGLQNFPELHFSQPRGEDLYLRGRLDVPLGSQAARYRITAYASPSCHSSAHGEGSVLLGSQDVVLTHTLTPPIVAEDFEIYLRGLVLPGLFLTATATSPEGNSSEFSRCLRISDADTLLVDGFE